MVDSGDAGTPATDALNNDICATLKTQLDVAVRRSDYNQRVVLSAMISHCLDKEAEDIASLIQTDEFAALLDDYDALYSAD